MKHFLPVLFFLLANFTVKAQSPLWVEQMQDPSVNFYTVQQNFNEYWKEREVEKGKGWKQFKRWEAFMEPRVFPEGNRSNPSVLAVAFEQFQTQAAQFNGGDWRPLGPYDGNYLNGIGRVNRLAFDPHDDNIIWAGTPAGGLWKSTDGGQNWTTNTDLLPNLGVSDIVIHPTNSSIMYIATGDQDGGDTYSYGVLKSTDGGVSWNPTGLSFNVSQQVRIQSLYLNPQNPDILIATTRQGTYRTTNAGVFWHRVISGNFNDLVQKPGNPDVLYMSSSNRVYKSVDNGISWNQLPTDPNGLPSSGISRIELAVTPDDPNMVYALYGASNNGFLGIYRSVDNGSTWTLRADSPNLLGWAVNGSDNGGQAWYDLAIAVDPSDKDKVYVGGVNIWRSNDGGASWNIAAHWYGGGGNPFVHADIHHLIYRPNTGDLYTGCDGGVYRENSGLSWDELNQGMNITQYYRLGASVTDTNLIIAGAQDNGTHLYDNNWERVRGGDGMECAIDPQNPNVMYASIYYGDFRKSTNGGNNFNAAFNLPPAGNGNWVTPFLLDPKHPDTIYVGFSQVFRSYNGGVSFSAVSPSGMTGGRNIDQMAISESDPSILYISEGNDLWRSEDRGNTFVNLSSSVPASQAISYIAVDPDDPYHIVISRSGYSGKQKVYRSFDGGHNWENLSDNLPNVPANCAIIENNISNGIYVGTDIGVYYRDDNTEEWVVFNANLPNVIVNELEITYEDRKLKAATYGRGIWVSPLYGDMNPPLPGFEISDAVCFGDTVTLEDFTSYQPDNWSWTITPNTFNFVNGTNANSQNPQVYFTEKGLYNISLAVSNEHGSNSIKQISAVAVGGFPLPFNEDFESTTSFNFWHKDNPSDLEWQRVNVGGNSPGNNAIRATQYFNAGTHSIITPTLNFENHDSVNLHFDYAYIGRPGFQEDTLRVYIAINCTDNWVLINEFVEDGSSNFITNNPKLEDWTPASPSDWCGTSGYADCPNLDLSAFAGQSGVRIKFEAASASDNNIYIDNIEISGNPTTAPTAAFSGPVQACALTSLQFVDQSYGSPVSYKWYFPGASPSVSTAKNPQPVYTTAGIYDVSLVVTNGIGSDSIHKNNFVTVDAADSVSISLSSTSMSLCTNDTLTVTASTTNEGVNPQFKWFVNGIAVTSANTSVQKFTGLTPGDIISASLISSEDCAFPAVAFSDSIIPNVYPITLVQFPAVQSLCIVDTPITLHAAPAGGVYSGPGINGNTFDPAQAGQGQHLVYYDYVDNNGCSYQVSQTILVDSPAKILFGSPGVICKNSGPVLLNTGFPAGGTYSGPGITSSYFFPDSVSAGTYTIYYTYTNGNCPASTDSINILVVDTPAKPTVIYQNGILESSITAAYYQWFRNGVTILGANSKIYTPLSNGNYAVMIRDTNACEITSDPINLLDVSEPEWLNSIHVEIFPNPAKEMIHIKIEGVPNLNGKIIITNSIGQVLKLSSFHINEVPEKALDISELSSGIYILSIVGDNFSMKRRFLKE